MEVRPESPRNVLIVGAGPVGLVMACALAKLNLEVDVVERQPEAALADPAFDGREIALTHASLRILEDAGVGAHIPAAERHPLQRAHVADGNQTGFSVDAASFDRDHLGTLVSNAVIRRAAWEAVTASPHIRVHTGSGVDRLARDGAMHVAHLADGRSFSAPLLIVADGRMSATRRLLGVATSMHDFGATMLVCRMQHATPHHGIATEWFGHGQTRALLPLDEYISSVVLTLPGTGIAELMAMDADAFSRAIETRLESRLGPMHLASTRHAYPLLGTWAHAFVGMGFALIGDAAVGMHPVTAHGFNLGVGSVDRLARQIEQSLARDGVIATPTALARYQRQHRAAALPLYLGTGAVVGLFTSERALVQPLRHAIIGGMRRLPPLRRMLAASLADTSTGRPGFLPHLRAARRRSA